ncbi:hypothetical protein BCR33DRAFT_859712 [Rhizoclosmatium globosum]|uniref:Uncharacterized protein n=1 Tax=Rhizoclosmatium globosum TaxID=329046 RepID=A0A1Y2ASR2_9FUNG|nr:hypothetical protein BCR33DRAFT_859712 [Rhizoclosmatium globosum]|eukprot:ORY25613.1 hypothetical protein BCR33DRAFT_859712 [Rhizoclosmatium globosum]
MTLTSSPSLKPSAAPSQRGKRVNATALMLTEAPIINGSRRRAAQTPAQRVGRASLASRLNLATNSRPAETLLSHSDSRTNASAPNISVPNSNESVEFAIELAKELRELIRSKVEAGSTIVYAVTDELEAFVNKLRIRGGLRSETGFLKAGNFEARPATLDFLTNVARFTTSNMIFRFEGQKCYALPLAREFVSKGSILFNTICAFHPQFQQFLAYQARNNANLMGSVRLNPEDGKIEEADDDEV